MIEQMEVCAWGVEIHVYEAFQSLQFNHCKNDQDIHLGVDIIYGMCESTHARRKGYSSFSVRTEQREDNLTRLTSLCASVKTIACSTECSSSSKKHIRSKLNFFNAVTVFAMFQSRPAVKSGVSSSSRFGSKFVTLRSRSKERLQE